MNEQNAGGTITESATRTPLITEPVFRRLQEVRRSIRGETSDGYLAVMLVNRAGWTAEQAAQFLGLDPASVNAWTDNFAANKNVAMLGDIPAPIPASL